MRIRHLEKRREQLREKFLSEAPQGEKHLYKETVSIFLASTIHAYLFEGYSGESLVSYLMKKIPSIDGYEECVYPHEDLEKNIRRYCVRVEKKYRKFLPTIQRQLLS